MSASSKERRFETTIDGVTAWAGPWETRAHFDEVGCAIMDDTNHGDGVPMCHVIYGPNLNEFQISTCGWVTCAVIAVLPQVLQEAATLAQGGEVAS